jgi:hypothetical protein
MAASCGFPQMMATALFPIAIFVIGIAIATVSPRLAQFA